MKYSTFKYADGVVYGSTTDNNAHWGVMIYWDDETGQNGSNEASRLQGVTVERGRDQFIDVTAGRLQFPNVGRAVLTLDNHDQRYNAWDTDGPLYGNIEPGKYARIFMRNGSGTDNDYPVMCGTVSSITPIGKLNQQTEIVIEDGMQWVVDNPAGVAVQQDIRIDEAVGKVLDAVAWPTLWGRDLEVSDYSFPFWWTEATASEELTDLMQSGLGYFCQAADGKARYINRTSQTTDAVALTDANTLDNVQLPITWQNYRNIVKLEYQNSEAGTTDVTISSFSTSNALAGYYAQTNYPPVTWSADYTYDGETKVPSVNVSLISYSVWYGAYGGTYSFADTDEYNLTFVDNGTFGTFTLEALKPTPLNWDPYAFVVAWEINGDPLPKKGETNSTLYKYATGYNTKPRTITMAFPWGKTTSDMEDIGDVIIDVLSTRAPYPILQIEGRPDIQFGVDLFDTVTYNSSAIGISGTYRVGKITHEWLAETGQATRTTLYLEPYISS